MPASDWACWAFEDVSMELLAAALLTLDRGDLTSRVSVLCPADFSEYGGGREVLPVLGDE